MNADVNWFPTRLKHTFLDIKHLYRACVADAASIYDD